jgi:hypothetical protein
VTSDYDLQLAIMVNRINCKVNPLNIDEIRDDYMKVNKENETEVVEGLALFGVQFKVKCRIMRLYHFIIKIKKMVEFTKWRILHVFE